MESVLRTFVCRLYHSGETEGLNNLKCGLFVFFLTQLENNDFWQPRLALRAESVSRGNAAELQHMQEKCPMTWCVDWGAISAGLPVEELSHTSLVF